MRNAAKKLKLLALTAVAIGWWVLGQGCSREQGPARVRLEGDRLSRLGAAWDPDQMRDIAAQGRAAFDVAQHESAMIRLEPSDQLEHLRQGRVVDDGIREIDLSQGSRAFPADCSPWGESSPCLLWTFPDSGLAEDPQFGGLEVSITDHRRGEQKFHVSFLARSTAVPLVTDRLMNYLILPEVAVGNSQTASLDKNTIALAFPAVESTEQIELHSIRVLGKVAMYAGASSGQADQSLDDEIRPVFFQWTGGEAAWDVEVPKASPAFKFGTGLLPHSSPVTFSVAIEFDGERQTLFRETISKVDRWFDHALDLSPWEGRSARLVFEAESDSAAVALWSSPRIIRSKRQGRLYFVYLVDALRPDFCEGFGVFRGHPNDTPAIRVLGEEGVRFTMALANGPSTRYSMPALFSGLYPRHAGIVANQKVPDEISTLAEFFRQNGFVTASFLLNGNSGRLRGLHQGFDHLFSMSRVLREARRIAKRSSELDRVDAIAGNAGAVINEFLFDFIRDRQQEDLFLFIHLMDPHRPYLPGEEDVGEFSRYMQAEGLEVPADRLALLDSIKGWYQSPERDHLPQEALLALYRGTVKTSDRYLQKFLDFLDTEGLLDQSTIVLTADHGEHLNEHPEGTVFSHGHPNLLEVLRVPLILRGPGIPAGGLVEQPVQLVDVAPTLLDLAGIPYSAERFDGSSLLLLMAGQDHPHFQQRPIVAQTDPQWSVLAGDFHSPHLLKERGFEIFNIKEDPREHQPLRGAAAQEALDQLVQSLALVARREEPEAETLVNEEDVLRQLRSLGYLQ